ncbi:MAG: dephospho-CoA kinase [Cytophagales bacterium]|nr:MAG: dephospho-CoA kinase [Cytophagales bacterium]
MPKTLKIGITGGIGVGKSVITLIFKQLGIPIYDADSRAKWLITHHAQLVEAIILNFGKEAYLANGELNRRYLAEKVFVSSDKTQLMNSLVHPKVGEDSQDWFAKNEGKFPYVLKEAALLYESGGYKELDKIIVVTAPLAIRIERIKARDTQRSEAEILGIISKQMPEDEKIRRADFLIHNDGNQPIIPQVLHLHHQLLALGVA